MDLRAVLRFAESRGFGWFMAWGELGGRWGGLLYSGERRGPRTAQSVKDPERRKSAKSLEMLYCRSGGQDADGDRLTS